MTFCVFSSLSAPVLGSSYLIPSTGCPRSQRLRTLPRCCDGLKGELKKLGRVVSKPTAPLRTLCSRLQPRPLLQKGPWSTRHISGRSAGHDHIRLPVFQAETAAASVRGTAASPLRATTSSWATTWTVAWRESSASKMVGLGLRRLRVSCLYEILNHALRFAVMFDCWSWVSGMGE